MFACVLLKKLCLEPLFVAKCVSFRFPSCPRFKGTAFPSGLNFSAKCFSFHFPSCPRFKGSTLLSGLNTFIICLFLSLIFHYLCLCLCFFLFFCLTLFSYVAVFVLSSFAFCCFGYCACSAFISGFTFVLTRFPLQKP